MQAKEIVHSVECPECAVVITDIVIDQSGVLRLGVDRLKRPFAAQLAGNKKVFRFYCRQCGLPVDWDSSGREIVDFKYQDSLEDLAFDQTAIQDLMFARVDISTSIEEINGQCKSARLRECVSAFQANILRVNEIAESTLLILGLTSATLASALYASHVLNLEQAKYSRLLGDDLNSPYMKEFCRSLKLFHELKQTLSADLQQKMRSSGESILSRWTQYHQSLKTGIQAVLLSQLSLAWTAFEVLSADLWVAAVNDRPNPLAGNFARNGQQKGTDKSVSITSLSKYANHDFDLSAVMGDLFLQERKVDFASLESTRFAYEKTFGMEIVAFADPDLKLLELLRNLILHRGGIVDQQFIRRLQEAGINQAVECNNSKVNQPFDVDSSLTNRLAASSGRCGIALLRIVTEYLK